MWDRIRETVTDRIFKIRFSGSGDEGSGGAAAPSKLGSGPGGMQFSHAEATGAGFAGAAADQAAAMKAQNQPQKAETIRREEAKVGRNQPCPCGSGKKYKQCHGKGQ
ncbi:MAG: SEC-C domain-containing protein [Planctomycetes bacterium]|nr:SEC-C domain-containing protein [Planctomycetota bacterium]